MKVEKVAAHYDYNLHIDLPFKESGFEGNTSKEMVLIQPTAHCLVNLTEWQPFVLTLSEIEHVHFERVTYATKAFDAVFIFKNWDVLPRSITAIDMKYKEVIQDWLNLIEITYTEAPRPYNWAVMMKHVKDTREVFYDEFDEQGEKKPAGWMILTAEGSDDEDEEEENEDSSYASDEDEESEDDYSDDDDDESFEDEDDDDDYDEDEEDALDEKGQSWEELERDARAADKAKRSNEDEDDDRPKKQQKTSHGSKGSSSQRPSGRR